MTESKKQMLYVSVVRNKDVLQLLFETENYYRNSKRQVYTEQDFSDLSYATISEDLDGLDRLGFKILCGLLATEFKTRWALAIYTGNYEGENVISLDEEPYRENPDRVYCGYMLLKDQINLRENIHIDEQRMLAALKVLQYLPLNE
jgi:hypothetical protein